MNDDALQARSDDTTAVAAVPAPVLDLGAVAADLADVETALARLEAGTYFTDEVTGEPLPEAFLVANPTARTATGSTTA
jgi:hypothetical protein